MRFEQLKKEPRAIVRKRLYKKGKTWIVASMLSFAGGVVLMTSTNNVSAATIDDEQVQVDSTSLDTQIDSETSDNVSGVNGNVSKTISDAEELSNNVNDSTLNTNNHSVAPQQNNVDTGIRTSEDSDVQKTEAGEGTSGITTNTKNDSSVNGNDNAVQNPSNINSPLSKTIQSTPEDAPVVPVDPSKIDKNVVIPTDIDESTVVASGVNGTSDWFETNDGHLYLMGGTLTKEGSRNMYNMTVGASFFDTSHATSKVILPEDSSDLFTDSHDNGFGVSKADLSNLDVSNVVNAKGLFTGFMKSGVLDISMLDFNKVKNIDDIFSQLGKQSSVYDGTKYVNEFSPVSIIGLGVIPISDDISHEELFYNSVISNTDFSKLDISHISKLGRLLDSCTYDNEELNGLDVSNISDFSNGLSYVLPIDGGNLDLSNWNTSKATTMKSMFEDFLGESITNNFDTSNVTSMERMFLEAANLETVDVSKWNMKNVESIQDMFGEGKYVDIALRKLDVSNWNTSSIKYASDFLTTAPYLDILDVSGWDTHNLEFASNMFAGFEGEVLDVSNFDTSNVVNFMNMLPLGRVKEYDLSKWDMTKQYTSENQFNQDPELYDYVQSHSFGGLWMGSLFGYAMFYAVGEYGPVDHDRSTQLQKVTFGPKNEFLNGDDVYQSGLFDIRDKDGNPDPTTWYNVGVGSVDHPQGNLVIDKNESQMKDLYDGSGKTGVETFVRTAPSGVTASVNIPSNLGDIKSDDVSGKVGDSVIVKVPEKEGYTADKTEVTGTIGDGKVIFDKTQFVTYTKIGGSDSGHSGGSSSNTDSGVSINVQDRNQLVSTFSDKPAVTLYALNGSTFTEVKNRKLGPGTDWKTDRFATFKDGNLTYFRVATNEWVKATQVYVYESHRTDVRTYVDGAKSLKKAEGTPVKNRELAAGTNWFSDRIGYIGNSYEVYYRVATNEFVKVSNAYEYVGQGETRTTKNDAVIYNDQGEATSNVSTKGTQYNIDLNTMKNIDGQEHKMFKIGYDQFIKFEDFK